MIIRSYDTLDLPLAWKRILRWAREGQLDVPDRLPFEVLSRLFGPRGPTLRKEHHLNPVTLVVSPKKSATSRPLARLSPVDLTLYQALVDRLAPEIEAALPPRDVVFAYRQALGREHDAFAGSPNRDSYAKRVGELLLFDEHVGYALTADIAGYFLHVNIDELERLLFSISTQVDVVRDLAELLRGWEMLGIRGLPQGIRPSCPLGNLYLSRLDQILMDQGVQYVRWMDDWIIATPGFHDARRIQDEIERYLYSLGLTLAADKTRILRWDTAVEESKGAKKQLEEMKEAQRAAAEEWIEAHVGLTGYPIAENERPDPKEINREVVIGQYDELVAQATSPGPIGKEFHTMGVAVLRDLQALEDPRELSKIPQLLLRVPSLTRAALEYLAAVAKHDMNQATEVYSDLLDTSRFMLDVEKLNLCSSILKLPERRATVLAAQLGRWALNDEDELVRARALLAWGAQSAASDFKIADEFWTRATASWRPYALIAIQNKMKRSRDSRYGKWSGEGRFTGELAKAIQKGPFGWRKL